MLRTLFGFWALPSIALAGTAGTGSAVGSSLRGATEPPSHNLAERGENSTDENSTEEVQAESLSHAVHFKGWYRLKNMNSGYFMTADCWFHCGDGTGVTQYTSNSWSNYQRWELIPLGGGIHMLKNKVGEYLSIRSGDVNAGARAEITRHYGDAAKWMISCSSGHCTLRNMHSHRYLTVIHGSTKNNADIVQWNRWSATSLAYQWNFVSI